MTVKASQFRQNLFQILDHCRDTGEEVQVERGGEVYRLVRDPKRLPLGTGAVRPWVAQDLEALPEFVSSAWSPDDLS